eukprot:c38768_g1_i1 orf=388-915(+)
MGSGLAAAILIWALAALSCPAYQPQTLEFYVHDVVTPTQFSNSTAKVIVPPTTASKSSSSFGLFVVIDDKITATDDFHSEELGRARGYYIQNSLDDQRFSFLFAFTAVFTKIHNGSTLAIFGQDPAMDSQRYLPVIGGTKDFELARGTAVIETVKMDGFDAILHFKVKLVYPQYA